MIVLQCNDLYFHWLLLFLESYVSHGNSFPVFISLYNGTDEMKQACCDLYDQAIVDLDLNSRPEELKPDIYYKLAEFIEKER